MRRGWRLRAGGAALAVALVNAGIAAAANRGDVIPLFKATDVEGRPVLLGDLVARRRVAIFFWDWRRATSTRAMQVLDRLQTAYAEKGLTVVAVEGEGSTAAQVGERVGKLRDIGVRQGYVIVPDPGGRIARQFGLTGTPQVFLIDGAGRVFEHFETLPVDEDARLEKRVRELLRLDEPAAAAARPAATAGARPAEAPSAPPAAPAAPADPKQALREKYRYFGGYHFNKGEYPRAEEYYRKYVDLAPADAAAWMRLGEACAKQGRYDAAREAWERVLRLDPGNAEADAAIRRLLRGEY